MLAAIRHAAVAAASFTASGLAMAVARRRAMQDKLALSPRETEVLNLLHDGLSIPAIAMKLFISVSTAKTYVARLYEKLGAANRAQALMAAMHHGLIDYQSVPQPGTLARQAVAHLRNDRDMRDAVAVSETRRAHPARVPAKVALTALPTAIPAGS